MYFWKWFDKGLLGFLCKLLAGSTKIRRFVTLS